MQEGRWTTVTPSQFDHERVALDHVRTLMPDAEPYRAWSNFTFTADTGHVHEVDLLVATPGGLYLVEVKSLHGRLYNSGSNWMLSNQSIRTFDNPLHLADAKAKRLRSLLTAQVRREQRDDRIPFIQGAVFLSVPSLQIKLDDNQLHWVFGPEAAEGHSAGPLPGIWSGLLGRTPRDETQRKLTTATSKMLPKLLHGVGIARSRRHLQVGSWQLDARPMDIGPTWQDHLAHHAQFAKETRRVRIYLVERNSAKTERASIERAARREMLALHGISHPGIVQVDAMEPHEGGPALIFRHDPRAVRLDHFMAQHGAELEIGTRLDMIRQLSDAIAYAHSRRLYHRALSARSVLVIPGAARPGLDDVWANPVLAISDWQAAVRDADTTSTNGGAAAQVTPPSRLGAHLERAAEAYLAPELSTPSPDPVALDVFGLGTLSYLLLSGQAPSATRADLLARLATENGLRPSAAVDSVSEFMDELVQAATAPVPSQRLSSVADFVELLDGAEEELTAPPSPEPGPQIDLLEARPGDVVSDWRIKRKLGTGSTSRAFLAENLRTGAAEVLKVALSDEKATRLAHEARVLRGLHQDSRIIRLAREEPIEVPPRTMIVLEHAGEKTVARKLREDGRLTVDELETYADYLFGAVDHLQGEGVNHRDIKPDNIAIRIRPNRTRQLVLFDFSLAAVAVSEIEAGTPRYLDPFLGTATRPVYDDHAERYAVAVTLHEMASGELPVWGDGVTDARYTEGPPVLAVEAFDPAIRDGLVGFFERALDRDGSKRFASLQEMRGQWQLIFRHSDHTAPVGSVHPDDDATVGVDERDEAASRATRATALEASGLTPRAVSAAHRLNVSTVGDLLAVGSKDLFSLPGLGAKTRGELQRRVKEWRTQLGEQERPPSAKAERASAAAEVAAVTREQAADSSEEPATELLTRIGLDSIVARLVPVARANNGTEVEAVRLLLRLPNDAGVLPDLPPWPQQPAVATRLEVTPGRIAQILMAQRKRWRADPLVQSVYHELLDILDSNGRVAGASELAAQLLARRGSSATGNALREAMALAAVRAAVEIDPAQDPRLLTRRHDDRLMIALEVGPDDPAETPAAPALLDHADALGKVGRRLAAQEVLPSPATVLRELAAVTGRAANVGIAFDDRRTVQLAAIASGVAASSPRLEIYPRDLDPVRALRLSQAGVVPAPFGDAEPPGLSPRQIQERVQARFPELEPLPAHPALHRLLTAAGFDLIWRDHRYFQRKVAGSSTPLTSATRRRSTGAGMTQWTVEQPELAAALRTEQRLGTAGADGGFRTLTTRTDRVHRSAAELSHRFGARHVSVAGLFVAHLRALVSARTKPTWQTVLAADAADPNSRDALKLAEFTHRAWQALQPELLAMIQRDTPLLLDDGAVFARYRAMEILESLADAARGGAGAVWLLCPAEDPGQLPRLDTTVVPVPPDEWIMLPDEWADNKHRSSAQASSAS
jgi:serine/threonine protein kinase